MIKTIIDTEVSKLIEIVTALKISDSMILFYEQLNIKENIVIHVKSIKFSTVYR